MSLVSDPLSGRRVSSGSSLTDPPMLVGNWPTHRAWNSLRLLRYSTLSDGVSVVDRSRTGTS